MPMTTHVLIVDDSPSVRELLVQILGADPGIRIVGCAVDGEQALQLAAATRPDVITMDLQMSNIDGFEATRRIMESCPVPIVIVSGSENPVEIDASFRAIEAGALMIVRRPFAPGNAAYAETAQALVRTVKSMAEVKVVRRWGAGAQGQPRRPEADAAAPRRLAVLGASTGGPAVLRDILAQLPPAFRLPLVIVQHLSPGFTGGLADWLGAASGFPVRVAAHGDRLAAGCAYVAPDGYQIAIARDLRVALSDDAPEHGMRPAVSHLFRTIAPSLRAATVAVLLTGMGKDGARELRQLRDDGALTIVQDRASSAVYGMPGEAIRREGAMLVLEPAAIGRLLAASAADPVPHSSFSGI
jgi:two-component system chemotaxis response regulator CheB